VDGLKSARLQPDPENFMMRTLIATLATAGLALATGVAQAQVDAKKAEASAKEAGCLACHAVSSKKVGPSFKDVSKKHGKDAGKIVAAVKADKDHADVVKSTKEDDLKLIASWIASL